MFLQASVILSTGGRVSASVHAGMPDPLGPGTHPPGADTQPGADTPPHQAHSPGKQMPAYGQ